ncbi:MAG: PQQ-binding-like beta-propeller repeat protein [Chitinophagaceae bacterium]|nr:PQQ-binding-like beta-propeller repeat protein [Chitinophagaceae bacterium]
MNHKYYSIITDEDIFICTYFEDLIDVYKLKTAERIAQISTIFGTGGSRISLCVAINAVCCASFYKGVALYNLKSGEVMWHNKRIKSIHAVFLQENIVLVHTASNKLYCLSASSGEELWKTNSISEIFSTHSKGTYVVQIKKSLVLYEVNSGGFTEKRIEKVKINDDLSFATLADDKLIVRRFFDQLTAYSLEGKVIWVSDLGKGYTVTEGVVDLPRKKMHLFTCYDNNQYTAYHYFEADIDSGAVCKHIALDRAVISASYSVKEGVIICSDGNIINPSTGHIQSKFLE